MPITVHLKFVSGVIRDLELDDNATVAAIKDSLDTEFMRETIRVCWMGDILGDDQTVKDIQGLTPTSVLVVTARKITAAAPPRVAQPQPSDQGSVPTSTPTVPPPQQPRAPETTAPAALPNVDSESVQLLESMGFTNQQEVALALRAAFGNVDRAVEYLVSGIPPNVMRQMQADQAAPPRAQAQPTHGLATTPTPGPSQALTPQSLFSGGQNADGAAELRRRLLTLPQFPQMVQLVRESPNTLPEIMNQLRIHQPEIFNLAVANQSAFAEILTAATSASAPATSGGQQQQQQIEFTPRTAADEEPIQRLVAMGGGVWNDRHAALAYIVTRRNEEAAANLLIDNNGLPQELLPALEQLRDQLQPPS